MPKPNRRIPASFAPLFPELPVRSLDAERDAREILARTLEHGRLIEVRWCIARYGMRRIHRFFRDEGHPSMSRRTVAFWRLVLDAREEPWATSRRSHLRKIAPWLD